MTWRFILPFGHFWYITLNHKQKSQRSHFSPRNCARLSLMRTAPLVPLRMMMENSCTSCWGQRNKLQLGMPPPETADEYSPKWGICKPSEGDIDCLFHIAKKNKTKLISPTALAVSWFRLTSRNSRTGFGWNRARIEITLWPGFPMVSGGCAVSAAPCVLLSRWLSFLHPGVCVCECEWACVCVCLRTCCLLRTGDPSRTLTKRKASAKCIKIKGTDKECVVASSDGAPHNLGPRRKPELAHSRPSVSFPLKPKIHIRRDGSVGSLLTKSVAMIGPRRAFVKRRV